MLPLYTAGVLFMQCVCSPGGVTVVSYNAVEFPPVMWSAVNVRASISVYMYLLSLRNVCITLKLFAVDAHETQTLRLWLQ